MLTLPIWAFVLCVLTGPVTYAALDAWRARRAVARARQVRYECSADAPADAVRAILARGTLTSIAMAPAPKDAA